MSINNTSLSFSAIDVPMWGYGTSEFSNKLNWWAIDQHDGWDAPPLDINIFLASAGVGLHATYDLKLGLGAEFSSGSGDVDINYNYNANVYSPDTALAGSTIEINTANWNINYQSVISNDPNLSLELGLSYQFGATLSAEYHWKTGIIIDLGWFGKYEAIIARGGGDLFKTTIGDTEEQFLPLVKFNGDSSFSLTPNQWAADLKYWSEKITDLTNKLEAESVSSNSWSHFVKSNFSNTVQDIQKQITDIGNLGKDTINFANSYTKLGFDAKIFSEIIPSNFITDIYNAGTNLSNFSQASDKYFKELLINADKDNEINALIGSPSDWSAKYSADLHRTAEEMQNIGNILKKIPVDFSLSAPHVQTSYVNDISTQNDVSVSSGRGNNFASFSADVDQLIGYWLSGGTVDTTTFLEGNIKVPLLITDWNIPYTWFDADLNANAAIAQKFTFEPKGVELKITPNWGDHTPKTQPLGSTFEFVVPADGSGDLSFSTEYSLTGTLYNYTGINGQVSAKVVALKIGDFAVFDQNVPLLNGDYQLYNKDITVDLGVKQN